MNARLATGSVLIVTLVGCSSGGGGTAPTAELTPANARETSKSSYHAARSLFSIGSDDDTLGTAPATLEGSDAGNDPQFDLRSFLRAQVRGAIASTLLRSATTTTTTNGPQGGSQVFTFHDNDNDQELSTGDTFDIVFNNYTEVVGTETETKNGRMIVDNIFITGSLTSNSSSISLRATFINMVESVTSSGGVKTDTFNGTFTITLSQEGNVESFELTIHTSILGVDAGMRIRQTLTDNTPSPNSWTSDFAGSFNDPGIGGRVSFSTPTVFAGTGDPEHDNPSSGVFVIIGAGNDTLTLTVIDNTQARIDLDESGDGSIEFTEVVSWTDLN